MDKTNAISAGAVNNTDALLPLLEPPGELETKAYYWAFPSRPHLLGRTTSGTAPWWRLSEPPENPHWGPTGDLERVTAWGPVGPHAIHACWRVSTLNRVRKALAGLPWTSIDVLRIGRSKFQEYERPVIVWIGVSPSAMAKIEKPWDLIASKLRAVRAALDADNLTDVECEMRESEILRTADASPRLLLPPRGEERFNRAQEEVTALRAVSTTLSQTITPAHCESSAGTLGLYLVAETEASDEANDDGVAWALTCHHVAFPPDGNCAEPPVTALLSAERLQRSAEFYIRPLISRLERPIREDSPDSLQTAFVGIDHDLRERELQRSRHLQNVLASFRASTATRTLGQVHYSPPLGVQHAGTEDAFTRDWALLTLDRQKFPVGFNFENIVDLQTGTSFELCRLLNKHIQRFTEIPQPKYRFSREQLLHLQGTVPVEELLGQSASSMNTERNSRRHFVLKKGSESELTAGIVLDIESVARHCFSGVEEESYELAVLHLCNPREFDPYNHWAFSEPGDSGAIVFDLDGRIVGMLTGGSGRNCGVDCSYVTPIAKLQSDIEQTIGRRVRIL
ncbi:MAG: hypothetical protein SEPTF4163_005344 [Sporothrix epigloea]